MNSLKLIKKGAVNKNGLTLIEVIVSFAILAIVSIIVLSALMTSASVKMKSDAFTSAEERLTKSIAEGASDNTTVENDLSITVTNEALGSSKTITIPGKVYTYEDEKDGKTFKIIGQ
ncbi:MAG: type II secretion system GspH family protein [Clostridiales Family XIII bacterium]|nr:type II secretion system GspH family protein [Clostridiales Family XIII bacterium]